MRLIDADALQEAVKIIDKPAWMIVRDAPTIDAVDEETHYETVHKLECLLCYATGGIYSKAIADCWIRKMNSEDEQFCMVGADDFCSYGERRTDDKRTDSTDRA